MSLDSIEISRERYDKAVDAKVRHQEAPGITEAVVRKISESKNEPAWMLDIRLQAYKRVIHGKMYLKKSRILSKNSVFQKQNVKLLAVSAANGIVKLCTTT